MSLKGVKILVDGWHLGQNKGSGVTTYSRTLMDTLLNLDADTSVLYGYSLPKAEDAWLQSALLISRLASDADQEQGDGSKISLRRPSSIAKILISANRLLKIQNSELLTLPENHKYLAHVKGIYNHDRFFYLGRYFTSRLNTSYRLLSLANKFDIFHVTYPMPVAVPNAKKVTTIHDMIPMKLPQLAPMDIKYFDKLLKSTLKESSLIFTVSESSKRDILDFYDVNPEKIVVTFQPFNPKLANILNPQDDNALSLVTTKIKSYSLSYKNYFIFVGTLEPKKNVKRIIEAYTSLDTNMQLVIVGKRGWMFEDIFTLYENLSVKLKKRIIFLGYLNNIDLACLYSGAICLLFPSLYEGFGIPPLEAMTLGCPVITSNVSSLPEVCGDAALYVDPYSVSSIADAMTKIIDDKELQVRLKDLGIQRSTKFNFENYQKLISSAYKSIL